MDGGTGSLVSGGWWVRVRCRYTWVGGSTGPRSGGGAAGAVFARPEACHGVHRVGTFRSTFLYIMIVIIIIITR